MKKIDLAKIITPKEVWKAARETKFVQRAGGKIDPFDFLMTMVFRLANSTAPGLGLICSLLNTKVSREAVNQRFTEQAYSFFRRCLQIVMMKLILEAQPIEVKLLQPFKRVVVYDSCSWDVASGLRDIFPGSGGCASDANCKLQTGYDFKSGSVLLVDDMQGTLPDQKYGKSIPLFTQEDDLIIIDLGYWSFETFYQIDSKGGFFLSRFNTLVSVWKSINGEYNQLELQKILTKQTSDSVEIDCLIRESGKDKWLNIRLIAFRVPEEVANLRRKRLKDQAKKKGKVTSQKSLVLCDWSIFVTNASAQLLPGQMVRSLYRVRWCIELIFKSWQSILRMHLSNVRENSNRFKCELYAKLILATIVHTTHHHLQSYLWHKEKGEISFYKLWSFIVSRAESLHEAIRKSMRCFSNKMHSLFNSMIQNCRKYHQPSRKTMLQRIDETPDDPVPIKLTIANLYIIESND
jgi:Transposase DDE domain